MSDKYELSRRKALAALGTIGVAGAGAGLGTSALFGDTESFENNSIQAGTTNLAVTLGLVDIRSTGTAEDLQFNLNGDADTPTADGEVRTGLTVGDMKPGDCIVLRATVDVQDNPMYVAVTGDDVSESGGDSTEPELEVDPDNSGDLGGNLNVRFGYDSDRADLHDNSLEDNFVPDPGPQSVYTANEFTTNAGSGFVYRGRNSSSPPEGGGPPGGHGDGEALPTRIGDPSMSLTDRNKVTHFVELCIPEDVGNEIQGDTISFDLVWNAEQVRNNAAPSDASEVDGSPN